MTDTTNCTLCVSCGCPALPRVSLDQAVIDLMESIALQESALSHILCAESQKMKAALSMEELDLCKLLEVNDSATNMVHAVANLELVLKEKLEFIANNLYYPSTGELRRHRELMSKCDCPPQWVAVFFPGGLPKNMYKSRKSVLLELLNIEICAILYNVYPKRKGNLTLLHYDAILFDVDGTLWDSAAQVAESWNEVLARYPHLGVRITAQDMYDNMGKTMMDIGKTLFPGLAQEECRKVMEECMTYENHYLLTHPGVLYPEAGEIMARLSRQYGLYIVSNCQSGYIEVLLKSCSLREYVRDIECYGNTGFQREITSVWCPEKPSGNGVFNVGRYPYG